MRLLSSLMANQRPAILAHLAALQDENAHHVRSVGVGYRADALGGTTGDAQRCAT
jgi:hypothetical protein